jgi:pyruvate dehydrogenase E2 component (dihydrolipoamide acetyltransferase)
MSAAERLVEVRVPDMGNFKDVAIIDVLVKPGESIEPEAPLVTLETEKATMDVPSTVGGVIEKLHIRKGGTVSAGDLIATVRSAAAAAAEEAAKPAPAAAPAPAAEPPRPARPTPTPPPAPAREAAAARVPATSNRAAPAPKETAAARPPEKSGELPPINEPGFSRAHAGPSVRKFARELGVDLTRVAGGGFKGRVTQEDVKAFVKQHLAHAGASGAEPPAAARTAGLPAIPHVDFAQFGPIETRPLGRIQRISGPRLHASWVNIPHVTQFDEADITEMEELRTRLRQRAAHEGIKLTPLAFIVRACVQALQEFPVCNASLDATGANLILKKYVHIGFAADTPNGLVVPVLRDANHMDIYEIARQLADLSAKARAGKLSPGEMQGGSFTISSLGGIGGTAFTPIINAPEVAILGVSRSAQRPIWRDGAWVPRLILPLSLSYDHRVIDGATAVRFTTYLAQTLGDPRALTEAVP